MKIDLYVLRDRDTLLIFTESGRWSQSKNKMKLIRRHDKARQMRGSLAKKHPGKKIDIITLTFNEQSTYE